MNPEQELARIEKILYAARPARPGRYLLVVIDHQITVIPVNICAQDTNILCRLTSKDINEGPTTTSWNRIHDRFAIFQKRGLI